MDIAHNRSSAVSEFVLICFPGITSWQHWLSIPIAFIFLVVLTANTTLLVTSYSSPHLHQPMYYLLCVLALVNLLMSFTISPKTLAILWAHENTISALACFHQMFMLYFCMAMEAFVFMCLAFDRYVAICNPLRHSSIITNRGIAQAVSVSLIGNAGVCLPYALLAGELDYCETNTIPHCHCEASALAKISCNSNGANILYHLVITSTYLTFLSLSLVFSYGKILQAVLRLGTSGATHKAFSTCSSHLILTSFVYCTVILSNISNRVQRFVPSFVPVLLRFSEHLVMPALNPIVYGIQTNEIRQGILKLLRKLWYSCA